MEIPAVHGLHPKLPFAVSCLFMLFVWRRSYCMMIPGQNNTTWKSLREYSIVPKFLESLRHGLEMTPLFPTPPFLCFLLPGHICSPYFDGAYLGMRHLAFVFKATPLCHLPLKHSVSSQPGCSMGLLAAEGWVHVFSSLGLCWTVGSGHISYALNI